jgi:hypothetical protein
VVLVRHEYIVVPEAEFRQKGGLENNNDKNHEQCYEKIAVTSGGAYLLHVIARYRLSRRGYAS